jgi:hypothetical protein
MQSALAVVCLRPHHSPGAHACRLPSHPRSNIGRCVPDLQGLGLSEQAVRAAISSKGLVEGKLTPVVANYKHGGGEQAPFVILPGAAGERRRRTKLESQKSFCVLLTNE